MDHPIPGEIDNGRRVSEDLQVTPNPFPFLRLPAEIRNEIYRLVLLTREVTTDVPNANHTCRTLGEGATNFGFFDRNERAVGSIRCEPWRTYTWGYQVSLLRANSQIYHEAVSIFRLENFWTIVRTNKVGFGKEMKDCGFPVAIAGDVWRHIRFSVMELTVYFPSLASQPYSDCLAVSTIHLDQLIRALWTAKGASEMEVAIHVQPRLTNTSPSELSLLEPFSKLRGIERVAIMGVSWHESIDQLTRGMTSMDDVTENFCELTVGLRRLQEHIKAQEWGLAIERAEKQSIHMADSQVAYGYRFLGREPGIGAAAAAARLQAAKEILVATAIAIAEVTLHLHQYSSTVSFARRALSLFGLMSNVIPVVGVPNLSLLPNTGTVPYEDEIRCVILLIRARAFIGMRRAGPARHDIEQARALMPHCVTLPSVSQAWHSKFGPVR